MKRIGIMIIGALALLGIGLTGYWLGARTAAQAPNAQVSTTAAKAERKILYYRNPMGLPDTSPVPKKDAMGMNYVPVYEGGDEQGSGNPSDSSVAASGGTGQAASTGSGQVRISVEKVQKLGVKTEQAALRTLDKTVRAVGKVEVDERQIHSIAPKFEGWIEKLYVKTTGEPVKKGQALFEVYSP